MSGTLSSQLSLPASRVADTAVIVVGYDGSADSILNYDKSVDLVLGSDIKLMKVFKDGEPETSVFINGESINVRVATSLIDNVDDYQVIYDPAEIEEGVYAIPLHGNVVAGNQIILDIHTSEIERTYKITFKKVGDSSSKYLCLKYIGQELVPVDASTKDILTIENTTYSSSIVSSVGNNSALILSSNGVSDVQPVTVEELHSLIDNINDARRTGNLDESYICDPTNTSSDRNDPSKYFTNYIDKLNRIVKLTKVFCPGRLEDEDVFPSKLENNDDRSQFESVYLAVNSALYSVGILRTNFTSSGSWTLVDSFKTIGNIKYDGTSYHSAQVYSEVSGVTPLWSNGKYHISRKVSNEYDLHFNQFYLDGIVNDGKLYRIAIDLTNSHLTSKSVCQLNGTIDFPVLVKCVSYIFAVAYENGTTTYLGSNGRPLSSSNGSSTLPTINFVNVVPFVKQSDKLQTVQLTSAGFYKLVPEQFSSSVSQTLKVNGTTIGTRTDPDCTHQLPLPKYVFYDGTKVSQVFFGEADQIPVDNFTISLNSPTPTSFLYYNDKDSPYRYQAIKEDGTNSYVFAIIPKPDIQYILDFNGTGELNNDNKLSMKFTNNNGTTCTLLYTPNSNSVRGLRLMLNAGSVMLATGNAEDFKIDEITGSFGATSSRTYYFDVSNKDPNEIPTLIDAMLNNDARRVDAEANVYIYNDGDDEVKCPITLDSSTGKNSSTTKTIERDWSKIKMYTYHNQTVDKVEITETNDEKLFVLTDQTGAGTSFPEYDSGVVVNNIYVVPSNGTIFHSSVSNGEGEFAFNNLPQSTESLPYTVVLPVMVTTSQLSVGLPENTTTGSSITWNSNNLSTKISGLTPGNVVYLKFVFENDTWTLDTTISITVETYLRSTGKYLLSKPKEMPELVLIPVDSGVIDPGFALLLDVATVHGGYILLKRMGYTYETYVYLPVVPGSTSLAIAEPISINMIPKDSSFTVTDTALGLPGQSAPLYYKYEDGIKLYYDDKDSSAVEIETGVLGGAGLTYNTTKSGSMFDINTFVPTTEYLTEHRSQAPKAYTALMLARKFAAKGYGKVICCIPAIPKNEPKEIDFYLPTAVGIQQAMTDVAYDEKHKYQSTLVYYNGQVVTDVAQHETLECMPLFEVRSDAIVTQTLGWIALAKASDAFEIFAPSTETSAPETLLLNFDVSALQLTSTFKENTIKCPITVTLPKKLLTYKSLCDYLTHGGLALCDSPTTTHLVTYKDTEVRNRMFATRDLRSNPGQKRILVSANCEAQIVRATNGALYTTDIDSSSGKYSSGPLHWSCFFDLKSGAGIGPYSAYRNSISLYDRIKLVQYPITYNNRTNDDTLTCVMDPTNLMREWTTFNIFADDKDAPANIPLFGVNASTLSDMLDSPTGLHSLGTYLALTKNKSFVTWYSGNKPVDFVNTLIGSKIVQLSTFTFTVQLNTVGSLPVWQTRDIGETISEQQPKRHRRRR